MEKDRKKVDYVKMLEGYTNVNSPDEKLTKEWFLTDLDKCFKVYEEWGTDNELCLWEAFLGGCITGKYK